MFLLSSVDNVPLLQDFHGVRLHLLVLQLNLNNKPTSGHCLFDSVVEIAPQSKQTTDN